MAKLKAEMTVARTFIDKCIKEHINNNFSAEDGAIAKLFCTELQFKVMDECLTIIWWIWLHARISDCSSLYRRKNTKNLWRNK